MNDAPDTRHVMLDLETMATCLNSAILAIGAVKFDPNDVDPNPNCWDKFHVRVNLKSNHQYGRFFDGDTIDFWLSPKQAFARDVYLPMSAVHLDEALDGFAKWFGEWPMPVWGNGAMFDNAIIGDAFKATGIAQPWTYRQDRCYRTLKGLAPAVEFKSYGTAHSALDDAISQALHMQKIIAHLGIKI